MDSDAITASIFYSQTAPDLQRAYPQVTPGFDNTRHGYVFEFIPFKISMPLAWHLARWSLLPNLPSCPWVRGSSEYSSHKMDMQNSLFGVAPTIQYFGITAALPHMA